MSVLRSAVDTDAPEFAANRAALLEKIAQLDVEHAKAFARKMQAGQIDINGGSFNVAAPFGGYKQSGVGRELGPFGLEEFTQPKSLQL